MSAVSGTSLGEPAPPPDDDRDAPFRRRTLLAIAIVGGLSLAVTFWMLVFGGRIPSPPRLGDRSAVGLDAFVTLLDESHVPLRTLSSDDDLGEPGDLLVLLPPDAASPAQLRRLRARLSGRRALVVLPKWRTEADGDHPGWAGSVRALDPSRVDDLLDLLLPRSFDVVRVDAPYEERTRKPSLDADLPYPQLLRTASSLEPILSDARGVLAGRVRIPDAQGDLFVLADVDLIDNHGLGRGANASVALGLIEALRNGGALVFDESVRVARDPGDVWGLLLEPPLSYGLAQLGLTFVVLLLSAKRFGAPRPLREGLAAGSGPLLESTAELLLAGRHDAAMLLRYERLARQQLAEHFLLPPDLSAAERAQRLRALLVARGRPEPASVGDEPSDRRAALLRRARAVHHWKESVVHGHR
ncbi:MAG: hypothetical protein H6825_00205 [Planctomycetes bacterium]|nr:hypothetical protein [Planctomycetota bacterium]